MSWEREPLWTKSRLYFERAFTEDHDSDTFGLWCAMGLELLARSTIAHFSPVLLAEPDSDHKHILHALHLGASKSHKKSIATNKVLNLCKTLITEFTDEELTNASALTNQRNEELHSGASAFSQYTTQQWIAGFYKCCKVLAEAQGENLTSLFGHELAKTADEILKEHAKDLKSKVLKHIAAYKKVFNEKEEGERLSLSAAASKQATILSYQSHHKVKCPACGCDATVQGDTYGPEKIENNDEEIIVRQSVMPTKFSCSACGLRLNGYGELMVANIADHFTHRLHFAPAEYYELVDPDDFETLQSLVEEHDGYMFSND